MGKVMDRPRIGNQCLDGQHLSGEDRVDVTVEEGGSGEEGLEERRGGGGGRGEEGGGEGGGGGGGRGREGSRGGGGGGCGAGGGFWGREW